jgi:hypothetical protein
MRDAIANRRNKFWAAVFKLDQLDPIRWCSLIGVFILRIILIFSKAQLASFLNFEPHGSRASAGLGLRPKRGPFAFVYWHGFAFVLVSLMLTLIAHRNGWICLNCSCFW